MRRTGTKHNKLPLICFNQNLTIGQSLQTLMHFPMLFSQKETAWITPIHEKHSHLDKVDYQKLMYFSSLIQRKIGQQNK